MKFDLGDLGDLCAMSRVHGMLLALAAMPGATITDKLAIELENAADRQNICIGVMFDKIGKSNEQKPHGPTIEFDGPLLKEMTRHLVENQVISHERGPTETFGRVYPAPEEASDQ
jgi:hypothetical protein